MATFKATEADNYGGNGGSGFFSISKNLETKKVRLMYRTVDDVEGMSVHKVPVGDSQRYVNCLREYTDPVDVCPLCASKKYPTQARLFIPIYNVDENKVQIWDRGKTMFQKVSRLCAKYATDGKEMVSTLVEVERQGEPKDTKTDYVFYALSTDDTRLEDLPEPTPVLGNLVLDKTADEMDTYLRTGAFPNNENTSSSSEETFTRRRSADRRTPATNNRGEAF